MSRRPTIYTRPDTLCPYTTLVRSVGGALPFEGTDRWHAYELGWLDARGKPAVATATITVPAHSPQLVESKSLKLYLNSLNAERFDAAEAVREDRKSTRLNSSH